MLALKHGTCSSYLKQWVQIVLFWSKMLKNPKDHEGKMSISLLRLELLYSETKVDPEQVYLGKCCDVEQRGSDGWGKSKDFANTISPTSTDPLRGAQRQKFQDGR